MNAVLVHSEMLTMLSGAVLWSLWPAGSWVQVCHSLRPREMRDLPQQPQLRHTNTSLTSCPHHCTHTLLTFECSEASLSLNTYLSKVSKSRYQ